MATFVLFPPLWCLFLPLSHLAFAFGATIDAVPSITVRCQDTELGHWQCGKSIGARFKSRIHAAFNKDATVQELFRKVRETHRGKEVFQSLVSHANQRYPLYLAELNGTAVGSNLSMDLILVANFQQELAVALGASVSSRPGPKMRQAVQKASMTLCMNCSDSLGCSADAERIKYSPPVGRCYSPRELWPQDQAWGSHDIIDSCDGSTLVRQFYASTDGTCAGMITDSIEIPLKECVGPFGRPRPWGVFDCKDVAEPFADSSAFKIPDACTDILLVNSSHGTAGWAHNEDFGTMFFDSVYFVRQTVLNARNQEVYSFASFTYPGILPGWAPGWNSFGLGISWNVLYPSKILKASSVGVTFVCRDVLSARSVEEAIRLATPKDLGLGQNFNVGSFHSKQIITIETAPGGVKDILQIHDHAAATFHANEYLRLRVPQEVDQITSSQHRKQAFERLTKQKPGGLHSMEDLLWVLGDTSDPAYPIFRRNDTTQEDTLFTVAFDLNAQTVTTYRGNPRLGKASQQWVEHIDLAEAPVVV
eukprot:TRINITY_DN26114_c0_g1_i1.p1 TRINITY_DN26114_c0_g1~~TRINITY_DN26114_c0_g1_i1.p1  ORF type:complete len:534 (-),score=52.77 TRINITY_DN26114_c0_g1_i1:37-1638(-)